MLHFQMKVRQYNNFSVFASYLEFLSLKKKKEKKKGLIDGDVKVYMVFDLEFGFVLCCMHKDKTCYEIPVSSQEPYKLIN